MTSLPSALYKYSNVFNKELVLALLNFKELNYLIPIIKGKEPPYKLLYNFSKRKLKMLREYLEDAF